MYVQAYMERGITLFKKKNAVYIAVIFITLLSCNLTSALTTYPSLTLYSEETTGLEAVLKWTSPPGTWKYNIYRSSPDDGNFRIVKTTSVPYFTDTGLKPSTTYWYYVRAYSLNRKITYSNHIKVITKEAQSPRIVLGFTTRYGRNDNSSYNSMVKNHSLINQVATYTYTTDSYGNLTGDAPLDDISYARSNNIDIFALITNNFSASVGKTLLESRDNRQNLINNIIKVIETNGYKGVNIDMEGIYSSNREHFTLFMSELYNTLKPRGLMVTLDIPAKTWDDPKNGWAGAYDYPKLSAFADEIIIMTYDEHYPGGPPGPIASIGWVEKVINYALTVMPADKIMLGVAAYGYDWSSKGAKSYGIGGIKKIAQTYNRTIQWDTTSKTPYFNYTDGSGVAHSVWFENSTSLAYKLDIVKNKNLKGIAIWKLGLEDADYWTTIRQKLVE